MTDYVCVKISGLNLLRIIDKLIKKNVFVSDVITKQRYIKFTIANGDLCVLDKICKQERKFYTIVYKSGVKQIFSRVPYMLGTFLAFILISTFIYSYSLFVYSVELSYKSNLDYDIEKVNAVLVDNGVVSGIRKNKFSISDISNLIMLNLDDVESCQVMFKGSKLFITIFPATKKYEVDTENLCSKYDAVILNAEAFSGNLKVKAGDIVKKGDVLIENQNGATGEVFGKVYFTATKIYNEKQQKITYTGRTFNLREFLIAQKWSIKNNVICPFNRYEVEVKNYYVAKNLFLPVLCTEKIYREIEINEFEIPFESVEEEIKNEVYEQAKLKIADETTITNVSYSIVNDSNYTRIDCFIETKMSLI